MKKIIFATVTVIVLGFFTTGFAQEKRHLTYERRADRANAHRPEAQRPIPEALVPLAVPGKPARVERGTRAVRGGRMRGEAARAAAHWADWLARNQGYREYYQIGFWSSLRDALQDRGTGSWDFRQGFRLGSRDKDAQHDGLAYGREHAETMATARATRDVETQFRDLSVTPDPVPGRVRLPNFSPVIGFYTEPHLKELFKAFPLHRFPQWTHRNHDFYQNWKPNPWRLYKRASYSAFYNQRWKDANYAFKCFVGDRKWSAYYHGLATKDDKQQFKSLFKSHFERAIPRAYRNHLEPGYRKGWNDGGAYGHFIGAEWSYRKGYYEGAVETAYKSSVEGFGRSYREIYRDRYQDLFRDWQSQPHPEIEALYAVDENEDGIYEPGENLWVGYTLVNYGGRPLRLQGTVEGPFIVSPGRLPVKLPARQRIRTSQAIMVKLDPRAQPGTRTALRFTAGPFEQDIDITIERPLKIEGGIRAMARDNLAGTLELGLRVRNISRKAVRAGSVQIGDLHRRFGRLEAGGSHHLSFQFSGLKPIDMVGGRLAFDIEVRTGNILHNHTRYTLKEQATFLDKRDLLVIMIDMAATGEGESPDIAFAQELMLRRISQDWQLSRKKAGNPWGRDRKKKTRTTALGDMVNTYLDARDHWTEPRVFTDMQSELVSLSGSLRGFHPFKKKQFKKLVFELE